MSPELLSIYFWKLPKFVNCIFLRKKLVLCQTFCIKIHYLFVLPCISNRGFYCFLTTLYYQCYLGWEIDSFYRFKFSVWEDLIFGKLRFFFHQWSSWLSISETELSSSLFILRCLLITEKLCYTTHLNIYDVVVTFVKLDCFTAFLTA